MKEFNSCDSQENLAKVNVNAQGNVCLTDADMSVEPEKYSSEMSFAQMLINNCGYNDVRQILCLPQNVVSEEHVEGRYVVQWGADDGPCLMKMELDCDFIYEGETREGFPYGKGVLKFVNGESDYFFNFEEYGKFEEVWEYKGDVIYGIPHGEGIWSGPDGTTYSGTWKNGMLVEGTKIRPSGREGMKPTVCKGTFYHGHLAGDSCEIDCTRMHYLGSMSKTGYFDGLGRCEYSTGKIMDGIWNEGTFVRGLVRLTSGKWYIGEYYVGKIVAEDDGYTQSEGAHGFGTAYHPNGDIATGRWEESTLVEGKIIYPDGSIKEIKPDQTQSGDNTLDEA